MVIHFHTEDVSLPTFLDSEKVCAWLLMVAAEEKQSIEELNYVFCSDNYLLEVNKKYLQHDYYTDIITFDYSEEMISGDIYISLSRVRDNANHYGEQIERELHRVIAHGLLHLMGYRDKSPSEIDEMRKKEDAALSLL